ncbi:segregation and condensation protein B [archaeon]|nr:segregation and condensation protein B [archaeon]
MKEKKAIVEAALFISSEPIQLYKLSEISGFDFERVRATINELKESYSRIGSVIEINEVEDGSYLMQVKDTLSGALVELLRPALPNEVLKTLSYTALKQPILQSEVIKARGEKAYAHIKLLINKEFINAEPKGRTKLLTTTEKFSSYFGLSRDISEIKKVLGRMLND